MDDPAEITVLLNQWVNGSDAAMERLSPLVYKQLHQFARQAFRRERAGHTLQPTALVNEAFLKLIGQQISWPSRAHLYALAARMMRRLLINYAKERTAEKRGGERIRIEFREQQLGEQTLDTPPADLLALDATLEALSKHDARKAELIELQYFAGLTFKEMAQVTQLSSSTLDRELRFARAWMKKHLTEQPQSGHS